MVSYSETSIDTEQSILKILLHIIYILYLTCNYLIFNIGIYTAVQTAVDVIRHL